MKKVLFGILVSLSSLPAMAMLVTGKVVDAKGGLVGVDVSVEDNSHAFTVTAEDGSFSLEVPDLYKDSQLVFSGVSYGLETQKLPIKQQMGTIKMKEDKSNTLDVSVVTECNKDSLKKINATAGKWSNEQNRCIPSVCNTPRYKLEFAGTDMVRCMDQVGMPCFDCDSGADSCEYAMENGQFICKVMGCLMDDEKVENNKCVSRLGEDCTKDAKKTDKNVEAAELDTDFLSGEMFCRITKCKNGYKVNDAETGCIEMLQECTESQKSQHPNASKTGIKKGTETCIALDCACGYKLDNEKCVEQTETACTKDTKPKLPKNAKSAKMVCENGVAVCKIDACDGVEFELKNNACVKTTGDECKSDDAKAVKTKLEKRNNAMVCVIKSCSKGYMPADDGLRCVQSEGECPAEQLAALDKNATKGELKKQKCIITECKDGFEPDNNKCVTISGSCKPEDKNATSGKRKFDADSQTEICVVTGCVGGYDPSEDGTKCVENADEKKKIDDAQAKYDAAKANEQSTANKLLGAASMGSMGIGGMMVASSLAEQNADADAELDMTAYLATFKCDYGAGMNIKGGETNIELPGASELIPLYSEYVALANDLKARKSQLGLKAGIESEKILDSATTGLYDDVGVGFTSGVYASLARALQNPDGEDAKKWAEQKDKTAQSLKTGAITAGVGAAVGIVGNVITNKIYKNKIKNLKSATKLQETVDKLPEQEPKSCPSGATGSYQSCNCGTKEYNVSNDTCDACADGQDATNGKCPDESVDTTLPTDNALAQLGGTVQTLKLSANQLFKVGSSKLTSEAETAIADFAKSLKTDDEAAKCDIKVSGYTDRTGSKNVNQALSEKRAKAVADLLKTELDKNGVSATITANGYGENYCICVKEDLNGVCGGKKAGYALEDGTNYAPCRSVIVEPTCYTAEKGAEGQK